MDQSSTDLGLILIRHHFAVAERLKENLIVILDYLARQQLFFLLVRHLEVEVRTRHWERCFGLNFGTARLIGFGVLFLQW